MNNKEKHGEIMKKVVKEITESVLDTRCIAIIKK